MRISPPGRPQLLGGVGAVGVALTLAALGSPLAAADEPAADLDIAATSISGVKPGGAGDLQVSIRNKGAAAAQRMWLSATVTLGMDFAEKYANCKYATISSFDEEPRRNTVVCAIDQVLEPGVAYVPDKPFALSATSQALNDRGAVSVTSAQDPSFPEGSSEPVQGTGSVLRLIPQDTPSNAEYSDTTSLFTVSAQNTADWELTGASLKGAVGDTVTATVKFTNQGPAWVLRDLPERFASVDVVIPPGTTVTKAHGFCSAVKPNHYRCGTAEAWLEAGHSESYPFQLKIDKVIPNATGKVSFFDTETASFDKNPANNTAQIVINGGAGSADGGPETMSTGGSGDAPSGDTLADTGADAALPYLAGTAAVLVAGGAFVLSGRRRRAQR